MEDYDVKIFKFKEQDSLIDIAQTEELKRIDLKFQPTDYEGVPKYLGINNVLCASYYVGVEWIYEKDNIALAVYPKENYDFNKMFMACLESSLDPEYLSNFYEIHFDKKVINIDNLNIDITILLIVHYVCILRKIINIGLKNRTISNGCKLKAAVHCKPKSVPAIQLILCITFSFRTFYSFHSS